MNMYQRSHQIWSVLVLLARNRQTITYGDLGKACGLPAPALGSPLYSIQYYCEEQELPKLTLLVVQQDAGVPGEGISSKEFPSEIQHVFNYDWLAHKALSSKVGPAEEEFERAKQNH